MGKKLAEYLPEFMKALEKQLESDQERWGNTWKNRLLENQERRTFLRYTSYYDDLIKHECPIPWLKIAGYAMICWVRENCPEWDEE
ncbi:hypothetical protein [Vibrio sp.]|uniref:hypothetical protein n=1 Tax=Vibrio sp. TaxID=678 RepID=UPI003D0ED2C7